jgi:hypothetical protein
MLPILAAAETSLVGADKPVWLLGGSSEFAGFVLKSWKTGGY